MIMRSKLLLVIIMSRVERKQQKKIKKHPMIKGLCIIGVLLLLAVGIDVVDRSYRYFMMIDESRALGYTKIDDRTHQIYFCGEAFYIDEEKIAGTYGQIKNDVERVANELLDLRKQLVEKDK